jgi:hypothetical protein
MTILCCILVDRSRSYAWHGPGFRKIGDEIRLTDIPTWTSRSKAKIAADALRNAIGLEAVVEPIKF